MTFEQWWKEYCVKHHIVVGSSYEVAIRQVALEAAEWGCYHNWYELVEE